jgi:hypothetical protein
MQSHVILQSSERAFATRIDVSDCDGDGRLDVLVSSPQMASGGYQRGAASVYIASSTGINWFNPSWHAEGQQPASFFKTNDRNVKVAYATSKHFVSILSLAPASFADVFCTAHHTLCLI